jgi:hypothetical protein
MSLRRNLAPRDATGIRRHLVSVVSAVITMAGLLAVSQPAIAGSASTLPIVASGVVVDSTGSPAAGVPVSLYLSANPSTNPLAQTTTDANGAYSIALANTPDLVAAESANGGYVNFDLLAGGTVTSLSRQWLNNTWSQEWSSSPAMARIRLAASRGTRDSYPPAPCNGYGGLPEKTLVSKSTAWTTVGEFHAANDTTGFFSYGNTADSTIGAGFQTPGNPWGIVGSVHISNTKSASAKIVLRRGPKYGRRENTQMQYGYYKWGCSGFNHTWGYEVDALQWTGSSQDGSDNSNLDGGCSNSPYRASFAHNSTFERSSYRAVDFNGAAGVFGATLDAHSGYSQNVVLHWDFGSNNIAHWLCGDDNYVTSSQRVFAGA